MKKKHSFSMTARTTIGTVFLLCGVLLFATALTKVSARDRAHTRGQAIAPAASVPQPFSGTYDASHVFPCSTPRHHFTVPAGQVRIIVNVAATLQSNDLTLTLLYGSDPNPTPIHTEDTGVGTEVFNYAPGGGVPAGEYQVQICESPSPAAPSMAPFTYNGTFTYDNTNGGGTPPVFGALPQAPQDPGSKIGYENFEPPGVLTQVTGLSSGTLTVEYLGRSAPEPSIGVDWNSPAPNNVTGLTYYKSDLEALFVSFDDSCSLTNPRSTWVNRRSPTSQAIDNDPIGFVDRQTGRVFTSELTLLSPDTVKMAFSDDDGNNWTPAQTGGLASAVDHQTIGGGPYHLINGVTPPHSPTYANAVYYCSQDIATALCSRSDDGGLTYGASVPIYSLATCGGLHGHVKVSPVDGTVYVPNRSCGGVQSVVVSQDNGATWAVHGVQTDSGAAAASSNVGGGDDPALAIDSAGKIYFGFSNFGGGPGAGAGVAVSDDFGVHWKAMYDVGAIYGVKNVCFPTAVAGDAGRAAIAFYGSTTPQSAGITSNDGTFNGVWHLYVAHTFTGGKDWTTTDVTPTMPMQRSGILRGGSADIWRNLADFFDMTMDKEGRVLVGYGNGCAGGNCAQAPIAADGTSLVKGNTYSLTASIARQSSGRRLLAAKDPTSTTSVPGMPFVTETRKGNVVRLMWNESDSGNSMINNYQIFRGTASGAEDPTPIATIAGTQTGGTFDDTTATDVSKTYYYKVVAVNSVGSSCPNNEIAAPYVGDTCNGLIIHKNDPSHPESTGGGVGQPPPLPSLLIDYVAVSEPPSTNNITFTIKVGNLMGTLPPNSRWRIAWDWFNPTTGTELYYIGMNTDATSTVTFEYGTLADAGVPAILVLGETKLGVPTGSFATDGTITMIVPKSAVGSPQPGDLLGAIGGKTITGDTPATVTFERSTAFVDHTFIKGEADNAYPAATYTITGGVTCSTGTIVPVSAVSRKTHGSAGTFDVDLPLIGQPGIEDRFGGASGNHTVVITFAVPVTVTSANMTAGAGGSGSVGNFSVNNTQVTVNLTNVSNAQTLSVNLVGVSGGGNSGSVSVPMGVLLADVNGNGVVSNGDVSLVKAQVAQQVTLSNFREDVNANGTLSNGDVSITQAQVGTTLP